MHAGISFSVFTKPWKMPLCELGEFVARLGFEAIELPVRPGYQVDSQNVRQLPMAARQLAQSGVRIASVAGATDELTVIACAEAGVPMIRTMVQIGPDGYSASVAGAQAVFDALVPVLDKWQVMVGVQNHCGRFVNNASGLRLLLQRYDPRHVGAVWDAAHNALGGEEPDLALEIVWPHLCMVNLKNALWQRVKGPEAEYAEWKPYWTSGRQGLACWPRVASELRRRGYEGVVCLTAEYDDHSAVDRLVAEDLAFARSLFT
jgi:sugar phosphate isomerase/epimerase